MKFPRNARIFRGQLDAAPFAVVFFLLVIFLMLGALTYTPGVRLQLPVTDDLPGTDKLTIAVAIDSGGRLYFQNQSIAESELRGQLTMASKRPPEPPTLILEADKEVKLETLLHLTMVARGAGITNCLLATLPRPLASTQ
jgi:biopolymer transport protein ExbD